MPEPILDLEPPEPISRQRAEIGLATPTWASKKEIWNAISVPTADIFDGYTPSAVASYAHATEAPLAGVSGGWRAGKSLWSGLEGVTWLPYAKLVWIMAKDYDMCRQEFIYLSEAAQSIGWVKRISIPDSQYHPCRMTSINGCIVETRTLADFKKVASKPPDLVIICEPGQIENLNELLELLQGRIAEKRGKIIMAGTSEESSEEWNELWKKWQKSNIMGGVSFSMPTWENLTRFPKGRQERVFRAYEVEYGEKALMAHFGGIPAEPRNLVLSGYWKPSVHVTEKGTEFDPRYPAELAIDPNYDQANRYAIELMQWDVESGRIWIADEIAEAGKTHDEMRELVDLKSWSRHVTGGVIDPYAGESHVFGAPSPVDFWAKPKMGSAPYHLRHEIRPRVNTTVQALKSALLISESRRPILEVNPKAIRFIDEANRWRREKNGEPTKRNCDALKATGYWLVDHAARDREEQWDRIPASPFSFDGEKDTAAAAGEEVPDYVWGEEREHYFDTEENESTREDARWM